MSNKISSNWCCLDFHLSRKPAEKFSFAQKLSYMSEVSLNNADINDCLVEHYGNPELTLKSQS